MSELEKEILVSPEEEGMRLDALVSSYVESRSQAEKLIKQSKVTKKDSTPVTKPSHKVRAGDFYLLTLSSDKKEELKPYAIEIPIVYKDKEILVINKPAGVVVHPGPGHDQDTLVNALIGKVSLSPGVDSRRPGIVHRLDRDVSGLMILARTEKAQAHLIEQFKSRKIKRIYYALALGSVKQTQGTIESFIGRHRKLRQKQASFDTEVAGSRRAITHYRILNSYSDTIHHLELQLETGRTHQIRVHLADIGLPILGESVYANPRSQKKHLNRILKGSHFLPFPQGRLALYSASLSFTPAIGLKELTFSLPWPRELIPLTEQLGFEQPSKV